MNIKQQDKLGIGLLIIAIGGFYLWNKRDEEEVPGQQDNETPEELWDRIKPKIDPTQPGVSELRFVDGIIIEHYSVDMGDGNEYRYRAVVTVENPSNRSETCELKAWKLPSGSIPYRDSAGELVWDWISMGGRSAVIPANKSAIFKFNGGIYEPGIPLTVEGTPGKVEGYS